MITNRDLKEAADSARLLGGSISPPFPKHLRLDHDARLWIRKEDATAGYDSEDGYFEILRQASSVLLVSHIHEPVKFDESIWTKRFRTVKAAMEYAEKM